MENWNLTSLTWLSLSSSAVFVIVLLLWKIAKKRLPPGPRGVPIFGNMFDIGTLSHQSLYKLRAKYGPVIWLQLGSVGTMVVQSPKAAAELFKNHDVPFSDRRVTDALTAFGFDKGAMGLNNYGPYWRAIRRLCTMEFLVNKRVNETAEIRRKYIDNMVRWIEEDVAASRAQGGSGEVQLSRFLFLMAFNLVGNLMLSRDLFDPKSEQGKDFFHSMNMLMHLAGKPNVADFLPFLKWLDPLGIKRDMNRELGLTLKVAAGFVKERVREKQSGKKSGKKDFLDVLLEHEGDGKEGPNKISEENVNIVILEMLIAGSETNSITIEWAMTELLRNPELMAKVKDELDRVVGLNRKVEEGDMDDLPYLQAVVKETLRLHPPLPLLLPRNAMEDTEYMGYHIPKNTQVLVNAWAIGRDQDSWEDPLSFKPERFLDSNIEYKGQHYELIPFGSGRRICVGFSLAHRVVHLGLATLLQSFDWELPSGVTPKTLDMEERMGLNLKKLVPLVAAPKKRSIWGSI